MLQRAPQRGANLARLQRSETKHPQNPLRSANLKSQISNFESNILITRRATPPSDPRAPLCAPANSPPAAPPSAAATSPARWSADRSAVSPKSRLAINRVVASCRRQPDHAGRSRPASMVSRRTSRNDIPLPCAERHPDADLVACGAPHRRTSHRTIRRRLAAARAGRRSRKASPAISPEPKLRSSS